jgi:tRNA(Ser,Leu) C12 N-acetylase TAN1
MLVSTAKGNRRHVHYELLHVLKMVGEELPIIEATTIDGLFTIKTCQNAFNVIRKLRKLLIDEPWYFRLTLKFRPIEVITRTDLNELVKASRIFLSRIKNNETFMIKVEKRLTDLKRKEVIEAVASIIERKVDLVNPDKILLIEILREWSGLALIVREDILSIVKEKRLSL